MTWKSIRRRNKCKLAELALAGQKRSVDPDHLRQLVWHYLHNASVKALALRRASNFEIADYEAALVVAHKTNLFSKHRGKIAWHLEPKSGLTPRYRKVCSLPLHMRVGQQLAKDVLHASYFPRPHIFDWPGRGGCPAAVAATRKAIDEHGRFVVVADIQNCYPSFNTEWIAETSIFPPEFVSAMLDTSEFKFVYRDKSVSICSDDEKQTAPRGLLQGGAASSSLLAIALDELPDHLPDGVVTIIQSDNIIIVCRSQEECDEAASSLRRSLGDSPAGSFSLTMDKVWLRDLTNDKECLRAMDWPRDFEQLGYAFMLDCNDRCVASPSRANAIKSYRRVLEYFGNLPPHQAPIGDVEDVVNEVLTGLPALSEPAREAFAELVHPGYAAKLLEAHNQSPQATSICTKPPWD